MPGTRGMARSSSRISGLSWRVCADGLGAVGSLACHFQLGLRLQQTTQTIPENRMVIGDDDAH